jgi:DNA polymerase IIIc chi subunit
MGKGLIYRISMRDNRLLLRGSNSQQSSFMDKEAWAYADVSVFPYN